MILANSLSQSTLELKFNSRSQMANRMCNWRSNGGERSEGNQIFFFVENWSDVDMKDLATMDVVERLTVQCRFSSLYNV